VKSLSIAIGVLAATGGLMAVEIGDTRQSVVAEKGTPAGQMAAGNLEVLRFADLTVKLRDGKVVSIDKVSPRQPMLVAPKESAPTPTPAPGMPSDVAEPQFQMRFVLRPEFHTTVGNRAAGTAFFARMPDDPQVYILTVQHLLGPMGGFNVLPSHEQVPTLVRGVQYTELFDRSSPPVWCPVAACMIPVGSDPKGPLSELAAFKVTDVDAANSAVLSSTLPAHLERVWVLAHVMGGVPEGELIHPAKVVDESGPWLICQFENPNIITPGASGSPVVNAVGEVVGIYQGHVEYSGQKYAYLIPSPLIIETLRHL
jgi:S1-C subfamily serine protease